MRSHIVDDDLGLQVRVAVGLHLAIQYGFARVDFDAGRGILGASSDMPCLEATAMQTAKQEVKALLDQLPDDATLEDIHYHLYVLEKIRRGEQRAENEGQLSQDDVEARLSKWISQ